MCTYTKLKLIPFLFFISLATNAQTGPAGVGNSTGANGQPENVVWLDASDLTSFGAGDSWTDKSGNGHDAYNDGGNISLSSLGGQNALDFSGFTSGNFSRSRRAFPAASISLILTQILSFSWTSAINAL